ncbi:MAG: hypothetical protein QXX08_02690 [Candidatus Bathyarchaeia archaeon]
MIEEKRQVEVTVLLRRDQPKAMLEFLNALDEDLNAMAMAGTIIDYAVRLSDLDNRIVEFDKAEEHKT